MLCSALRGVRVGIDMSTASWTGSDGGGGGEGDSAGASNEDVNPVVGVLEGRSGTVEGSVEW